MSAEPDKKRYIKFETPSILYTVVSLTNLMERLEAPALYIWDCDNAGEFFVSSRETFDFHVLHCVEPTEITSLVIEVISLVTRVRSLATKETSY